MHKLYNYTATVHDGCFNQRENMPPLKCSRFSHTRTHSLHEINGAEKNLTYKILNL